MRRAARSRGFGRSRRTPTGIPRFSGVDKCAALLEAGALDAVGERRQAYPVSAAAANEPHCPKQGLWTPSASADRHAPFQRRRQMRRAARSRGFGRSRRAPTGTLRFGGAGKWAALLEAGALDAVGERRQARSVSAAPVNGPGCPRSSRWARKSEAKNSRACARPFFKFPALSGGNRFRFPDKRLPGPRPPPFRPILGRRSGRTRRRRR